MSELKSAHPAYSVVCDIGVVVKDLDKAVKRLEALGIGPFRAPQTPPGAEGMYYQGRPLQGNVKAAITWLGNIHLELFQPLAGPNPWEDFVKTKGEGIHHIGFKVVDVQKEVDRLTDQGAEVTLTAIGNGKLEAAYIDLKVADLIIELSSNLPERG